MNDLIDLHCPRCRQPLDGENNSRVFFCLPCGAAYDLQDQGLEPYDLHVVQPPQPPAGEPVYFPLWAIESRLTVTAGATATQAESTRLSLVPALFIKNVNYFGDIGMYYTWKRVPLPLGPRVPLPVLPADRGLRAALAYPAVYLYREQSLNRDIGAFRYGFRHHRFGMLLVPFARQQDEFVDPLLGWRYPSGALV